MFDIVDYAWRRLPDMGDSRGCINACRMRNCIYLCGGNTLLCEKFDIVSETYVVLPFQLSDKQATTAICYNREITVVSQYMVYKIRADELVKKVKISGRDAVGTGSVSPVVCGKKVYFSLISQEKVKVIDIFN